jgi:hypothetical protein
LRLHHCEEQSVREPPQPRRAAPFPVMPAQAGIHVPRWLAGMTWTPAFAGVTRGRGNDELLASLVPNSYDAV